MADQDQDKTEQPTPFKLREARKRGQVSKSMELNSFLMLLALLGMTVFFARDMIVKVLQINSSVFSQAHSVNFEVSSFMHWISGFVSSFFSILIFNGCGGDCCGVYEPGSNRSYFQFSSH